MNITHTHNPAVSCMFLQKIVENVLAIRKPSKIVTGIYFTFRVPEISILRWLYHVSSKNITRI